MAWQPLASTFSSGIVLSLAFLNDGTLLAGGSVPGGVVVWNGFTWSAVCSGWIALGSVNAIVITAAGAGDIVAGGGRVDGNGTLYRCGQDKVWRSLGAFVGGQLAPRVNGLAVARTGELVVVGTFPANYEPATTNVAVLSRGMFFPIGSGLTGGSVASVAVTSRGGIFAAGSFTNASGSVVSGVALWAASSPAPAPDSPAAGQSSAAAAAAGSAAAVVVVFAFIALILWRKRGWPKHAPKFFTSAATAARMGPPPATDTGMVIITSPAAGVEVVASPMVAATRG